MSDEEDAGGYRPPTPPPQSHGQKRPPPQKRQSQQYSPVPPPAPTPLQPRDSFKPARVERRDRERDLPRGDRYIPRDRDRDRDQDRDKDDDRDRDRDRDRESPRRERDLPTSRDRDWDSESPRRERDVPRSRNRDWDRESPRRERDVPRNRNRDWDRESPRRDRDRDRDSPRDRDRERDSPPRDLKRHSVAADPSHLRRPTAPPANESTLHHNGSKRQSITERLMSTWQARKGGEPPAGNSLTAPSRRASSASTAAGRFNPIARVREWLDTCNAEHGDHCSGPPGETWRPLWLIDSVNRCLVRARATDRYIALSYVYEPPLPSTRGPVETLRENLDMLTASLDDADIPQTILDAMWLARKVGVKYLWVDRFCIVQDDDVEREEYVKNMAYVFANAYLTIVAAAGDAESGLNGLVRRTPAKAPPGKVKHEDLILGSRWATRAWTVQEGMYSRRKVYVFEETVTWECHCEVWQGAPGAGGRFSKILKGGNKNAPCLARTFPAATGFLHPVWPDMDEYARIAMDYSSRRVTLMSDTTRALRGITTVMSKSFAGGFVFGMPVCFLDIAMLWQPRAMIRRRMMVQPVTGMNPLPSWSWLGWHYDGVPADMSLWRAAADYVQDAPPASGGGRKEKRFKSPYAFRLRPLVSYELTDRATYTRLPNDGLMFRDRRHRRTQPLPAGWSRSGGGGFRYAGDPECVFRYPVPVGEMNGPDAAAAPLGDYSMNATLLSFSTTVAYLEVDFAMARNAAPVDGKGAAAAAAAGAAVNGASAVGIAGPGRGYGVPLAIGNIWSRTGKWCGNVTAHDSWLGLQGANHTGEEKLEFIAVSTASERGGSHVFDIQAFRDNMDEDEIVDFVNVLWVERVGGVCYRRGLGHVVQRVWDAVARDRVEILLG
ncbi:hypothetical protein GCG54_00007848 [Colletotrichum gloeosporioides]|uniref:Heterokaryon incompatibility domain-containing protein n=1 Tax=Colletotrichum gloeosporioides TaxID=474922 RepID=A0A8H4CHD1_COLGL|nr:uncharacterized protein GCG54_00007848 [Colletotrichum gloeosporioides]KAF3804055.1 hypothetical protein GCG54_00007848 [Colletotrichum gloeosporioides]